MVILDFLFMEFHLYRKSCGGSYQRWWIDYPICAAIWFRNLKDPPGLGLALLDHEDY